MTEPSATPDVARLMEQLQRSQAFHAVGAAGIERELSLVRRWQSARLARTHADLLRDPCYRPAAEFFLEELYGDRDLRQREHELARTVPVMARALPARMLQTAALALELNALSYELDARLTRILAVEFGCGEAVDEASYVAAYRRCANYELRHRQLDLVEQLGQELVKVVRKRLVHTALALAGGPARLAGVGELHRFLEAGFHAFRHMGADAATFVVLIVGRERGILERIRRGEPRPLDLPIAENAQAGLAGD
ncbi:MAG: hypothetical protein EKK71_09100 [Candidatus Competibacteraceae bacterium]|nr:MAG: hypothetical protein EKK71_09100 [Candidatus Competibacteraceae bacterium]